MKTTYNIKNVFNFSLLMLSMCLALPTELFAQKKKVRINLSYHEVNQTKLLKAKVVTKEDRSYIPVADVSVDFYSKEQTDEYKLGAKKTDSNGLAEFVISTSTMSEDSTFHYFASVASNPDYKDKVQEIEIEQVTYTMKLEVLDSVNVAIINFKDITGKPIAKVPVKLYVKRMFGLLPIGEKKTTNAKGKVSITIEDLIPGDENGMIELIARVEDHDDYGNIDMHKQINWGIPLTTASHSERALWAGRANAPIYLVVTANSIIIGIWFVILYIVFQLVKLKKLGKQLN